jgi:hypothetical protein
MRNREKGIQGEKVKERTRKVDKKSFCLYEAAASILQSTLVCYEVSLTLQSLA